MSPNSPINPYGRLLNHMTVSVKDHLLTAPFTETLSPVIVIRGHVQSVFCNSTSMKDGWVQSRFQISDSIMNGEAPSGFWILISHMDGYVSGLNNQSNIVLWDCNSLVDRTQCRPRHTHTPAACSVLDTGIPLWIPRFGFNTYKLWLNYCILAISLYHRHFQYNTKHIQGHYFIWQLMVSLFVCSFIIVM